MDRSMHQQIFTAIKSDDLVLFAGAIKGNENISFGRFPVLSLCYLYGANKILKSHFQVLCKVSEYCVVNEFFEIYNTFKKVSGRTLRLYTRDCIISPLEMLAILHKDNLVKKYYKVFKKDETIISKLKTIYSINNQKVRIGTSSIEIHPSPLSVYQQKSVVKRMCLACIFAIIFLAGFLATGLTLGVGIVGMPARIGSDNQLKLALNSNGNYVLTKDISLDDIGVSEFTGVLDGNGKTIYISTLPSSYLLAVNNGTIRNVNIAFGSLSGEINTSLSLLVGENNGTIDNVTITCDELSLDCFKSDANDIYITAFATTNNGTITNSNLTMVAEINATGQGECILSGFVGVNKGIVKDSKFLQSSTLTTHDVDATGFVASNEVGADIYNCKNYASITQDSSLSGWSPNVGGINLINYGNIECSYNLGSLIVKSLINDDDAMGNVFVGGISTMNYATIKKCLNKGNLITNSEKLITYAGGVSAYSSYWIDNGTSRLPSIINCGNDCNINVQTSGENVYVFAGGISGFLYGEMRECYSLASFESGYDETKYFIGTTLGSSYLQYQIFTSVICISASENYVLDRDNAIYQIGCLINNGQIVSTGLDCTGEEIITSSSREVIEEQEVYWDE